MTTSTVESTELPIINDEFFKSEKKKREKKVKYNIDLLIDIIERDDCGIDIFLYENKCNRETRIYYVCNCGKKDNKKFRDLYEKGGAFCEECKKENTNKKYKKTNIEKYGVEYPVQSENKKEKMKLTNLERHGVEYPFQSESIKEKIKKTNLEKYGVEYPIQSEIIKEKSKQTNLKNLGVEYPIRSEKVKQKMKTTNLERYGVENSLQCPEIFEKQQKSCYKMKEYLMPSGQIIEIQGYEYFALNELLFVENIKEIDIITNKSEVPKIWYFDKNNKEHRYYTDIYIISQNKCIEVKSNYTSECNKDIIKLKENATMSLGYQYEIRIYDRKGNRL